LGAAAFRRIGKCPLVGVNDVVLLGVFFWNWAPGPQGSMIA
jgi:hypothetical protein